MIATEEGSDYQVHPNRKFDELGFAYHPSCEFLKTPRKLQPHQERVITEKKELDDKLEKLLAFIDGGKGTMYKSLVDEERQRLTTQARIMKEYSDVLADRIAAF